MTAHRISGFVVSYNRAALIEACLRSIRFVDQLIVIDKSSTDGTREIAARYADLLITAPWSPTVEESRAAALALCQHDRVVFLDDDELLSPEAIAFLRRRWSAAPVVELPLKHYVLGCFDPGAYYWPEYHPRAFRKGAVSFGATVHGGLRRHTDQVERPALDSGVCIHHLSHRDVAQWIEKTNRYTSHPDRVRCEADAADLIGFAHARIDHWLARGDVMDRNGYPAAVALLRAVYDVIDRVKVWEETRGGDGAALLSGQCEALCRAYDALERRTGIRTGVTAPPRGLLSRLGDRLVAAVA